MAVHDGYMCKKCNKVYRFHETSVPVYCDRCGADLVEDRYMYNLKITTDYTTGEEKLVETRESNIFGGYDCTKTIFTENVKVVKIRRKNLFFWEVL